jgi:hypothetical protein
MISPLKILASSMAADVFPTAVAPQITIILGLFVLVFIVRIDNMKRAGLRYISHDNVV